MLGESLAVQESWTVCACVPVPFTPRTVGELEASLLNEAVPDVAPGDWGAKVTVNWALWPAGMVTGNDNPLTVNCALLTLTEDTVTVAPEAISCAVFCEL